MSFEKLTVVEGHFYEKLMSSVKWKVPNCFSFLHEPPSKYRSPHFETIDGTWALRMYPVENKMYIRLLVKEKEMDRKYSYKLSIMKTDGTEYKSVEGAKCNIHKSFSVSSQYLYLTDMDLCQSDVAPGGVLTISCIITYYRCIGMSEETNVETQCKEELDGTKETDSEALEKKNNDDEVIHKNYLEGTEDLSRDFKSLLTSGEFTDVTMRVKDREFKVHKTILQARSSVFAAMFRSSFKEKNEHVVHITDCDPDVFHRFLLYLYSGDVEKILPDETPNIYRLAHKYDVKQLKKQCILFMIRDLSVDNFCDVMALEVLHEESELIEKAINFFSNNVREIITTAQWLIFQKENPVEANDLHIKAWNFNSLKN